MKLLPIIFVGGIVFSMQMSQSIADDYLDEFSQALTEGKVKASIRYRYEGADNKANELNKAKASTIRTRLGYETGELRGFSLYAEMEDIREVGDKKYNDGPGPTDRQDLKYDTVADPEETELNQAYIQFNRTNNDQTGYKLD